MITERIDEPQENIEKFREIFLYILCEVIGKPNVGQTVLYKLLYFIDFNYYEIYEEQIMGLKYIKNTYGPTPLKKIIDDMVLSGDIEEVETKHFDKYQKKYVPTRTPDLTGLSAIELQHIDDVLHKYSKMTAKQLSDLSHIDVPWLSTEYGDDIPYESVFYRTQETTARTYAV